jgi:hypothetical protein
MPSKLFCDAALLVRVLGWTFSWPAFISIDAVGSNLITLHEYTDCDTHQRATNNSPIKQLNVRVLGFVGGCLVEGSIPSVRCHFSWSLPLALKLGEHFMSTSVVALAKAFSMRIEALCAAPPGALTRSPSQMPLCCPVPPQAARSW